MNCDVFSIFSFLKKQTILLFIKVNVNDLYCIVIAVFIL